MRASLSSIVFLYALPGACGPAAPLTQKSAFTQLPDPATLLRCSQTKPVLGAGKTLEAFVRRARVSIGDIEAARKDAPGVRDAIARTYIAEGYKGGRAIVFVDNSALRAGQKGKVKVLVLDDRAKLVEEREYACGPIGFQG